MRSWIGNRSKSARSVFQIAATVVLAVGLLLDTPAEALPQKTTIDLAGVVFPCVNCELTTDGVYRVTAGKEQLLLRPFDARRKLFEVTPAADLAKLNKTGELLRFLLGQEVYPDETEKAVEGLLATEGGRSTLILSFDSLYEVHERTFLKMIVGNKFPTEVVDGIRQSSLSTSEPLLEMALIVLTGHGELSKVVDKLLDREVSVTLERVDALLKKLELPECAGISAKLKGELLEIREAIENTSDSRTSAYREAGLKPAVRRLMRKQRLLMLTGRALEATSPEEGTAVLKDLTTAYDPTLDTPSLHEAIRHLLDLVPNGMEILEPIKSDLVERDSTIRLMLNPPPTVEHSLIAVGIAALIIVGVAIWAVFSWRTRQREQQQIELREGLTFDERRELHFLLAKFDLEGSVSLADLKQAFRTRAKELHPDARGGTEGGESFIDLQHSYARAKELLMAFRN